MIERTADRRGWTITWPDGSQTWAPTRVFAECMIELAAENGSDSTTKA